MERMIAIYLTGGSSVVRENFKGGDGFVCSYQLLKLLSNDWRKMAGYSLTGQSLMTCYL